jgi:large subunit ribosomal protein L31e
MARSELTPASRDYTINLHSLCHGIQFKKKAPRALREIRKFAVKNMLTTDVRVDVDVNQYVWNKGIRNIPRRVRVRLVRKKNENEEKGEKFYTEVRLVKVKSFKNLKTEKSRDE